MATIASHAEPPSRRPPATATVSARAINAVATRANADGMFNRDSLHPQNPSLNLSKSHLASRGSSDPRSGLDLAIQTRQKFDLLSLIKDSRRFA